MSDPGPEAADPARPQWWERLLQHLGQALVVAGGVGYALGYLFVRSFAKELGVSVNDLGVESQALLMCAGVFMFLVLVGSSAAIGTFELIRRRAVRSHSIRQPSRYVLPLALVISTGLLLIVSMAGGAAWGRELRRDPRDAHLDNGWRLWRDRVPPGLELIVEPVLGTVTDSGTTQCAVRLSDRVYIVVPDAGDDAVVIVRAEPIERFSPGDCAGGTP